MSKPEISCSKNGPMIVKGLENFINSDGTRLATRAAMGLCRCGASKNKPFCDGSHIESGFSDEISPDRTQDEVSSYECPSGALSYSINGQAQPESDREASISIEKNGPFRITGGITFNAANWGQGASREHYTLCRCGASKNKPFCDGSHVKINFDDSA